MTSFALNFPVLLSERNPRLPSADEAGDCYVRLAALLDSYAAVHAWLDEAFAVSAYLASVFFG